MMRQVAWPLSALQRAAMLLALLVAGLPLWQQLLSWLNGGGTLTWLLDDNAYYTLRMAAGWLRGEGWSFNGVEAGNGVQPLGMLLATLLGLLSGSAPATLFLMALLALFLINAATLAWFQLLYRERLGALSAWLAPLFLMVLHPSVFARDFDALLAMPALYYLLQRLSATDTGWQRQDYLRVGLALAVLFLARFDSLVLMPLAMTWLAWRQRPGLAGLGLLALPVLLTLTVYGAANLAGFGHVLPASLLARAAGTPGPANFGVYGDLLGWLLKPGVVGVVAVWLLAELAWRHRRPAGHGLAVLLLCMLALLLQIGLYATLTGWALLPQDGYLVVMLLLAIILRVHDLAGSTAGQAARGGRLVFLRLLQTMLLLGCAAATPAWGQADAAGLRNQRDIESGVLTGKTLIMGEHAGSIGFWVPGVRIAQTEGLAMSPDFVLARRDGQGMAWIDRRYAVDELVVDRPWLPTMHHGGDRVYLVVEPIRARLWQERALVYCFPQFAVLDEEHGDDHSRLRFAYAERMTCPQPMMDWVNDVNDRAQLFLLSEALRPEGLVRSFSLLDHWLAGHQHPPLPVVQQETDLE